jgi:TolB-like protein
MKNIILMSIIGLSMVACTSPEIEKSTENFPLLSSKKVVVYGFQNYTETPLAGKRAASLVDGILSAKGYQTANRVDTYYTSRIKMCKEAQAMHIPYLLTGAVSEWRYKTGIDGEPAVSLSLKLLNTSTCSSVWSATASDNNWGNASIGTTAQSLLNKII